MVKSREDKSNGDFMIILILFFLKFLDGNSLPIRSWYGHHFFKIASKERGPGPNVKIVKAANR